MLVKFEFEIEDSPTDTFLDMSGWHKGIVFVNGFNIGRYFRIGPQQTLYVPAPLLKSGNNEVWLIRFVLFCFVANFTNELNLAKF